MINFKVLGKCITQAGLWEKPLGEFSREEILKLAGAIAVAQLEQSKTCGSCWYFSFKGSVAVCLHPDHPNWVPVWTWGMGCRDWSDLFGKEIGPHKLNRKPKARPEEINLP